MEDTYKHDSAEDADSDDPYEPGSNCIELGEKYAMERNLHVAYFPAKWDKYGKSAGYRRNTEMADYADALIAFWDGKSRGTAHMIKIAKERNLKIRLISY